MFRPSLLILSFTGRVEHLVPQTVSMLIDLWIVCTTDMLLCHVHVLAVLHGLHHDLIQMVAFDVELMQEVILIEVHHLL